MSSPAERGVLKQSLRNVAPCVGLDLGELALDLVASLEAVGSGAPEDPFFAHNLASLINSIANSPLFYEQLEVLSSASFPLLRNMLATDPDDLTLALALSHISVYLEADEATLKELVHACGREHAGGRLHAAVAIALTSVRRNTSQVFLESAASDLLGRLDDYLAKVPESEPAAMARLRLLLIQSSSNASQISVKALERFDALYADAEAIFGPGQEREQLYLIAATTRLESNTTKLPKKAIEGIITLTENLATSSAPPIEDILKLLRALTKKRLLERKFARRLLSSVTTTNVPEHQKNARDEIMTLLLEAADDTDALVQYHTERVRAGNAGKQSLEALAKQWASCLYAGAPSTLTAEVERWVAQRFPNSVARSFSPEVAMVLLDNVAATQGPAAAATLADTVLLKAHKLSRNANLVTRTVQLLAEAGTPEKALALGHNRLRSIDAPQLRLTLAKIHLGAAIRIAEAESLVRPLASVGGSVAAEARAIRDSVVEHPDFELERRRGMLDVEKQLGIDSDRQTRCRIIFPSDRYALAELPDARAPGYYQHRYLRVMVHEKDLPDGIGISNLSKGYEFTAFIVAEDDHKGDRIRVYWIKNGTLITPLAAPPTKAQSAKSNSKEVKSKEVQEPSEEQELAYNIGGENPALVRVERVLARKGLVFGSVLLPSGDGEPFPIRVGIHRRFVPMELKEIQRGLLLNCHVGRSERTKQLRYDATSEIVIVTAATSPADSEEPDDNKVADNALEQGTTEVPQEAPVV